MTVSRSGIVIVVDNNGVVDNIDIGGGAIDVSADIGIDVGGGGDSIVGCSGIDSIDSGVIDVDGSDGSRERW